MGSVDCRSWYGLLDEMKLCRLMEIDAGRVRGEGGRTKLTARTNHH